MRSICLWWKPLLHYYKVSVKLSCYFCSKLTSHTSEKASGNPQPVASMDTWILSPPIYQRTQGVLNVSGKLTEPSNLIPALKSRPRLPWRQRNFLPTRQLQLLTTDNESVYCLGQWHPISKCLSLSSSFFSPLLVSCTSWQAAADCSNNLNPATHVEDQWIRIFLPQHVQAWLLWAFGSEPVKTDSIFLSLSFNIITTSNDPQDSSSGPFP